jgi:hypothetical protein
LVELWVDGSSTQRYLEGVTVPVAIARWAGIAKLDRSVRLLKTNSRLPLGIKGIIKQRRC